MARNDKGPTREDWVSAGLRQLAIAGIESVKVERLAESFGISKGPFYWRFSRRDELLAAMLHQWKREFTLRLIEDTTDLAPRKRLEDLFKRVLHPKSNLQVGQTDAAMRNWAAQDPLAARTVRQVDARRVDYLFQAFRQMGASQQKALQLARSIYMAMLGLFNVRRYTPQLANKESFLFLLRLAMDEAESGKGGGGTS
jgi:AcrR family transcriptional regulator